MRSPLFATCLLAVVFACSKKEENKKPIETAAPEATAMVNGKSCYLYAKGRDTITMSLAMNANNANGELIYRFDGKDKNEGTFSGTFIGDTLYADYSFSSEGTTSVRESIFLRTGDVLTEGHGEMEEKGGKMIFKNPRKVQFDAKSVVLAKIDCKE